MLGNALWAIPDSIEAILSVVRLFPPNSLYKLDDELFLKYFNYNDDEWNSIRAVLQGTHFKRIYCNTGNISFGNQNRALHLDYGKIDVKDNYKRFFNDFKEIKELYYKNRTIIN